MPPGIVSRFISRCYYLVKDELFWKNGVILRLEETYALVTGDPAACKTSISVTGSDMSELMSIIRHELDHIHRTLNMVKNTHYSELIPCHCSDCRDKTEPYFFDYDYLKRRNKKGFFDVDCFESLENVTLSSLLKGFEAPVAPPASTLPGQIINAAAHLMSISKSLKPYENCRNDLITLLLSVKGVLVKDQSRAGLSETLKSTGSPDFKFTSPGGDTIAFMEAFNLKGIDRNTIQRHLKKLFNYDAAGVSQNFILVYAETDNFSALWEDYRAFLREIDFEHPLEHLETNLHMKTPTDIKVALSTHHRNGCETSVYHFFVRVTKEK